MNPWDVIDAVSRYLAADRRCTGCTKARKDVKQLVVFEGKRFGLPSTSVCDECLAQALVLVESKQPDRAVWLRDLGEVGALGVLRTEREAHAAAVEALAVDFETRTDFAPTIGARVAQIVREALKENPAPCP